MPSRTFDLAERMHSLVPRLYTALYTICMHDAQERVALRYIPAVSIHLLGATEPGYKSLKIWLRALGCRANIHAILLEGML